MILLFVLLAHAAPVRFTQLTPHVWMHTSEQEVGDWGLVPSNGLVVVGPQGSILVDTAWDDAQTEEVLTWAETTLGSPVQAAVFTHAHADKMGGVGAVHDRGIPTWAHALSNQLAPSRALLPARSDLHSTRAGDIELPEALQGIEVYAPGPGHTYDNLVVHADGVLFGGCIVRPGDATSLGNTADGSIPLWAGSVQRIADRFPAPTIVVPSHGPPGDRALLAHTIELANAVAPAPDWTPLRARLEDRRKLVQVTVEQRGSIVFEQRLRPGIPRDPDPNPELHDIRSAGKSITALAVGLAIDRGHLASVDVAVWPLLGAGLPADDARNTITVRDLLSMASGLHCDDGRRTPGREARMYRRRDWRSFALGIPLTPTDTRGTFSYCTAGVFLLGQVVQQATGVPFDQFVQQHLFDPLDIHGVIWRRSPTGEVQSGGQLAIAPADLAKLGRLVLDHGTWHGEQVVPAAWIHAMLQPVPIGGGAHYGWLWWFGGVQTPEGPTGVAYMSGNGGNLVVLAPEHDAVIVVQSAAYDEPDAHARSFEVVEAALAQLPRTSPAP